MYLARRYINNRLHYLLRESFLDDGIYKNRDLIDLGDDPGRFINYPGGSSFYLDDLLFDLLEKSGFSIDYDEIEPFFFPFLDPYIRSRLDPFLHRTSNRRWKRMDASTRKRIFQQTHVFDRRRIHFLRFGQTDLRELDRSPSLFKILLDKSRDELEQLILEREQDLSPHEYTRYIYAVFDLQQYFSESYARTMPHALSRDRLDEYFVAEICRLDNDKTFWQGMKRGTGLVSYMIRYVIMYFDYSFSDGQTWNDFFRAHIGSGHRTGPMKGSRRMSMREVTTVFGRTQTELSAMSRSALIRLYRKKALSLHPDKGGDHDAFIELTTAYNELLRTKPE
jgi:hypothetical protein